MESRRPVATSTRPIVLIVDGHDETLALYALALSGMGFDVVAARNTEDAYHRARRTHPDIIVTEISHPMNDGWSFVDNLKHDTRTRDIPVVVLTGHGQPSLRERSEREGCAATLLKPCLPEQLALRLRVLLGRSINDERASVRY
jgi:CheY-like chemotaxis protein